MRLSDDILRSSDDNMIDLISKSFVLASVGRFGLLPSPHPFEISLNVSNGVLSVDSLRCLAITRGGSIIDIRYDTLYSCGFNTQVAIPEENGVTEYILVVSIHEGEWTETADGMEEPAYSYALLPADASIPNNAMPIARIVDEFGWRPDDMDFVPPCLFVASHVKYIELQQRFRELLTELDAKAQIAIKSGAHNMISAFWPLIQQLRIAADKERDTWTPMSFLSNVQKCVSAFTCACMLDENIELADAKMFQSYIYAPYNYKEAYQRIKIGLKICFSIIEKVEKISEDTPIPSEPPKSHRIPAPTLPQSALIQTCNTSESTMPVLYDNSAANIFFTVDGSVPTPGAAKATKTRDGFKIKFDNGFRREKGKEPVKTMIVKLMAIMPSGESSEVATYTITLRKDLKFRDAIPI